MNIHKYTRGIKFSFTLVSLLVLFGLTSIAAITHAQEESIAPELPPTTTPQLLEEQAAQRKTEADMMVPPAEGTDLAERKPASLRGGISERAQERITNLAANMSNRMDAAMRRLENISERLAARIQILETEGLNTTAALQALNSASTHLSDAKLLLEDIDMLVFDATTSEAPREKWLGTRQTYVDVRDSIKLAHNSLRTALTEAKNARKNSDNSPDVSISTPATTSIDCPQDVLECSDGSFVSRVAPSCEFAECPALFQPNNCPDSVKLCADGSFVGRSGPNCEFAACSSDTPIDEAPTEPIPQ